jgi:hypothetical protein
MGIHLPRKRTSQRTFPGIPLAARISLAVSAVFLGVIPGVVSSGSASGRPVSSVPGATAARAVSLNLTTNVHLVGRPGHIDYAKGTVSGTFSGTTSCRFVTIGSSGGSVTFTIYPASGGSILGRAATHGRVVGPTVYFSGTASIIGGTGRWAHAHGTNLKYAGTSNRQNYRSTSVMHGSISV